MTPRSDQTTRSSPHVVGIGGGDLVCIGTDVQQHGELAMV